MGCATVVWAANQIVIPMITAVVMRICRGVSRGFCASLYTELMGLSVARTCDSLWAGLSWVVPGGCASSGGWLWVLARQGNGFLSPGSLGLWREGRF